MCKSCSKSRKRNKVEGEKRKCLPTNPRILKNAPSDILWFGSLVDWQLFNAFICDTFTLFDWFFRLQLNYLFSPLSPPPPPQPSFLICSHSNFLNKLAWKCLLHKLILPWPMVMKFSFRWNWSATGPSSCRSHCLCSWKRCE